MTGPMYSGDTLAHSETWAKSPDAEVVLERLEGNTVRWVKDNFRNVAVVVTAISTSVAAVVLVAGIVW